MIGFILRINNRWLKNQFEFETEFFIVDDKGLRQACADKMEIKLTFGTCITEGFALESTRVAVIGSRGVGWCWKEGQWARGMRRVLYGPRSTGTPRVEKELVSGAAVEGVFHHSIAAVAFDFFAVVVVWFHGYLHVLVGEMLILRVVVVTHLFFLVSVRLIINV